MFRISIMVVGLFLALMTEAYAHSIYIKRNPTNESGIEWGVDNASGFVRWRAYIRGISNNGQGLNSGWQSANGWWYYDLSSLGSRVMFRTNGLENQQFELTYWAFRSDGSWEFGEKRIVTQDSLVPSSSLYEPASGQQYTGTPRVRVSASDNGSGVEWVRLYLWVPSGYVPSGWTSSGSGNYYRDFYSTSVDLSLNGAVIGSYTLTAWVRDRAGNIAYEPWGRVSFSVAQSNSQETISDQEEIVQGEEVLVSSSADGFIFPVQTDRIYRWEHNIALGEWYDYQPFGALFNFHDKVHLGSDINRAGTDHGQPVYAVYDCVVRDLDNTSQANGWGRWLLLRCFAPSGGGFYLDSGKTISFVDVLYAHLAEISVTKGVSVKRGARVGSIGNANGYYGSASHLHFEMRIADYSVPGQGYLPVADSSYLKYFVDPIEFIENNRVVGGIPSKLIAHPYQSSGLPAVYVEGGGWKRQYRSDTELRHALGYGNHLWVTGSGSDKAQWRFRVEKDGTYDVYIYLPRKYATAREVRYAVWHDGSNAANPYRFTLNQSQTAGYNKRIYIGHLLFLAGKEYVMVMDGSSAGNGQVAAVDALEVVSSSGVGIGGGVASSTDRDGDFMPDEWESRYGLNLNLNDANEDPDGDGLTNLQEYYLGSDPNSAGNGSSDEDPGEWVQGTTDEDKKYPYKKDGDNSWQSDGAHQVGGGCNIVQASYPAVHWLFILFFMLINTLRKRRLEESRDSKTTRQ